MRKWISLFLALCLVIPATCVAEGSGTLLYQSDFSKGLMDGWRDRGVKVTVTKRGTLLTEQRTVDSDGPGRFFDLAAGTEYLVSVEVLQNQKPSADFIITLERTADGKTGWDNLVSGTAEKGKWTELSGTFTTDDYDSYQIYVETLGSPKLKYEIRNFRIEAPGGLPKARQTDREISTLIAGAEYRLYPYEGMQAPLLTGADWEVTDAYKGGYGKRSRFADKTTKQIVYNEFTVKSLTTFYEDPEQAQVCYNSTQVDGRITEKESILIDGHPAQIVLYDQYNQKNLFYAHCGVVFYVRQNRLLQVRMISQSSKYYIQPEEIPAVTMEDMRKIAEHISYDVSQAPVTEEDVAVRITPKTEQQTVSAGKSIELDAEFVNPEKAKKESNSTNYDRFTWSVIDAQTGEAVDAVQLNTTKIKYDRRPGVERGRATAASLSKPTSHQKVQVLNKLDRVIQAEIVAESASFHTKAVYPVLLLPKIRKMSLEPKDTTLYAGSDGTAELHLTIEPADIPFVDLSWSVSREGIVEVQPGKNGTAAVKPLARGTVKVTVTGPEGKKAAAGFKVIDPVESIELSLSGTAKAGKKVNVKADLLPRTAGVKDVEWSLDVEESIATVNTKGVVSIAKDVPAGTVITVTCRATGAPAPVVAQITLETAE